MTAPRFSLVIPHYEGSVSVAELDRCLASLRRQSFTDFEVLLYHDGPKAVPFTQHVQLEDFPQVAIVEETAKRYGDWGHSLRDRGIHHARGEYIVHLNADNLLYPQALEAIDRELRQTRSNRPDPRVSVQPDMNSNDIVIFPVLFIGMQSDGTRLWQECRADPRYAMVLSGYPARAGNIDCMQLVMRRELWLHYGGWYDRSCNSDGAMYERFVRERRAKYVPQVLGEHW